MVVGYEGKFFEMCALEFYEIPLACYHHPYACPHETTRPMDTKFLRYD